MLKFLENRQEDLSPKRSPIKYHPEMCYGNSYQSPQEFQTTNTIFHRRSYINPFLKFQKQREEKITQEQKTCLQPKWTHKVNLSMVEQHKIVGHHQESSVGEHKSRYLDSFHQELATNPTRFRMTRGQFTNYIERNNHYKSIGPLQGIQRTQNRIEERKKSVWIKPVSKKQEMTSSLRYASSLNTTIKSSISKNSQLLTQKIRIRRNRQRIQKSFRRDLQNRKNKQMSYTFDLPKHGPEHQIYLLEGDDPLTRYLQKNISDKNEDWEELQKFQNKIYRKFK